MSYLVLLLRRFRACRSVLVVIAKCWVVRGVVRVMVRGAVRGVVRGVVHAARTHRFTVVYCSKILMAR